MRKHALYLLSFMLITLYFEIVLNLRIMGGFFTWSHLRIVFFSMAYVSFFWVLIRFFQGLRARRLFGIFIVILTSVFISMDLYYQVMGDFYSIFISGDVLLGVTFLGRIFQALEFSHAVYLLPLIGYKWLSKRIYIERYQHIFGPLWMTGLAFAWIFIGILMISPEPAMQSDSSFNYSALDIYETQPSAYQVIREFGVLTYLRLDAQNLRRPPVSSPSVIEEFEDIQPPQEPNDYTGLIEGKNVIFVLAESFDKMAIHPKITPVLTQLFERGMVFDRYYAPHYYRNTADTEFMLHTGFYPSRQVGLSMESFIDNTFTQTLPRLLRNDYRTYAYHNYTDYFYPRTEFLGETIGFDVYQDALDLGLMDEAPNVGGPHEWPSDLELFESSVDDYINDNQFFTYYLTVSGHMDYDRSHPIVQKNIDQVAQRLNQDDPLLDDAELMAYYAAQMELEAMISAILSTLHETGRIDDTVLVLASDHYPYGLSEDSFETAGAPLDERGLDIHNVPFVIYHPDIQHQHNEDVFSSVDVTPTLANLLGLTYDTTSFIGHDVFAESKNVVRFQNSSILSDDYYYDIEALEPNLIINPGTDEEKITLSYNEMIFIQNLNHQLLDLNYQGLKKP